jgi:hypothetical protein
MNILRSENMLNHFKCVCIDNRPPTIPSPVIVIPSMNKQFVGEEVFMWLRSIKVSRSQQSERINQMTSLQHISPQQGPPQQISRMQQLQMQQQMQMQQLQRQQAQANLMKDRMQQRQQGQQGQQIQQSQQGQQIRNQQKINTVDTTKQSNPNGFVTSEMAGLSDTYAFTSVDIAPSHAYQSYTDMDKNVIYTAPEQANKITESVQPTYISMVTARRQAQEKEMETLFDTQRKNLDVLRKCYDETDKIIDKIVEKQQAAIMNSYDVGVIQRH